MSSPALGSYIDHRRVKKSCWFLTDRSKQTRVHSDASEGTGEDARDGNVDGGGVGQTAGGVAEPLRPRMFSTAASSSANMICFLMRVGSPWTWLGLWLRKHLKKEHCHIDLIAGTLQYAWLNHQYSQQRSLASALWVSWSSMPSSFA